MRHLPAPRDDGDDVHIASFIVHVAPFHLLNTAARIAALPGAEVHAATPEGKVVVTLEARGSGPILAAVAAVQQYEGVLAATLVYQCADTPEAMNEELPDAHSTQGLH